MARRKSRALRIYISVDFEGAACVIGQPNDPKATLGSGLETNTAIFRQAQRLVTAETNAAIRGALAAGATEVLVEDNHGCGHNLLYEELHPEAKVLMGGPRSRRFCLLDNSFAGLMLLCHHARAGEQEAVLSHSYSSVSVHRMLLNGRPIGEVGMDSLVAGDRGVPVILVSGDEAVCAEARAFLGRNVVTVATKKGLGRNCALSLSPAKAQALTEAGAKRAVETTESCKPVHWEGPFILTRVFKWESQADAAIQGRGAERLDPYTVRWKGRTVEELI
jgi:D-amino peptidase